MTDQPTVLVVHAIDTEGPLGGDARRLPDGSAEFMDDWAAIDASLAELTSAEFRLAHADSEGNPYLFNWFILDFTGFRTNPKNRVARYHDTYDHLVALPIEQDGLHWHYHAPPASGAGDQWAETWLESNEHNQILARRLLERHDFPVAFRAGGTIEEEAASAWLDEVFPLDYSNRVSNRSVEGASLNAFNWFGAPERWTGYRPSHASLFREGLRRRHVYRSVDLLSRYNSVGEAELEECFREAERTGTDQVLSFFSHDNRDMRPETYAIAELLARVSNRLGVPWASCTAEGAHRRLHGLVPAPISLATTVDERGFQIVASDDLFQSAPFVAARLTDGRFCRLHARSMGSRSWHVPVAPSQVEEIGVAAASVASDRAIEVSRVLRHPLRLERVA